MIPLFLCPRIVVELQIRSDIGSHRFGANQLPTAATDAESVIRAKQNAG